MKLTEFFKKVFSLGLWVNLIAMVLVIVLICLGVKFGIDVYTNHGQTVIVPDIKQKQFSDAKHLVQAQNLKIIVSDTGYVKTLPPDCILEQSPEPGRVVKPRRAVFVVVNASHTPMLTIPDVIDNCSYREARAKLLAIGFKIGETEYIYGEKDWLYGLKVRGKLLQNGQKVSIEDQVVMQVGNGLRNASDSVMYMDDDSFVHEDFEEAERRPTQQYHSDDHYSDDFSSDDEEDAFDDFQVVAEP